MTRPLPVLFGEKNSGDSYSLVDMQSSAVANNLAFVEYDLALINADHGPRVVVEELLSAMFHVFREPDPIADCHVDPLSLEHAELPRLTNFRV